MESNSEGKGNNLLNMAEFRNSIKSACLTIKKVVGQAICITEKFVIDYCMRWVVENYDSRHGKKKIPSQEPKNKQEVNTLSNVLQKLRYEIKRYQEENESLQSKVDLLSEQLDDAIQVRNEQIDLNNKFASDIESLQETLKSYSQKKVEEITRTQAIELNKPQEELVYKLYAEPDATGTMLRKVSSTENKYTLYELLLPARESMVCKFSVVNNEATPMYIEGRQMTLKACSIIEMSQNPQKIITVLPGVAVKENNNWVITEPAKIKLL